MVLGVKAAIHAQAFTAHCFKQKNVPGKENFAIQYGGIEAINTVLDAGFGADKLQMGIAQYARAFGGVESNGGMENLPGYNATMTVGGYIYNPNTKVFVGYESPEEVVSACKFIKEKGLKGAIMWSVDTDLPVSNPASLIATYRNAGCYLPRVKPCHL